MVSFVSLVLREQTNKYDFENYNSIAITVLTVVISLKSRHAPQTKRFTVAPLETAFTLGRYSSTSLDMASRDSEVALSPVYLHLHSRHTLSNDMAPLASGTELADMLREKALPALAEGVKAVVRAAMVAKRANDAFMMMDL
jgi:hypothetical protein